MSDLLPCPFCGGAAEIVGEFELDAVACQTCYARTDAFVGDGEHAAAAWNRRAPADPALLALARLGAMVISGYLRQNDTAELCLMAGLTEETPAGHAHRFPGIIDAIARLLAPDGADGAGGGGE